MKPPCLDGKPYTVRIYFRYMKVEDRKAMDLWLKENISGRHRLFRRAKFLDVIELYLASVNDALVVRIAWPDLYIGSSEGWG